MFFDQFTQLCESNGTTPTKFVTEILGLSSSKVTAWKKGSIPKYEILISIAEHFHVSVGALFDGVNRGLTEDESFLLSLYAKIPSQEQQRLIGRAEYIAEQAEEHAREQAKRQEIRHSVPEESAPCESIDIPFSTLPVSAGLGDFFEQDGTQETINVPATPTTRRADFAVRVDGDSMEPMFSDGDIVLVEQEQEVPEGQVGIFAVNGAGYIKKAGPRKLISANKDYDDILISPDDSVRCFGLVIGKL